MGTEFLVACLWVVVLAYWFWSRLPARADTVGVYRRALRVLEHATPTRVVPAYRLHSPAMTTLAAVPRPAVALFYKRAQMRRRRRDTLLVLLGAVLVTIAAALLTRSDIALAAQVVCDFGLVSYVSLLVRATRASIVGGPVRHSALVPEPVAVDRGSRALYPDWSVIEEPARLRAPLREPAPAPAADTYAPAHALRQADLWVMTSDDGESYGDEIDVDGIFADDDAFGDEIYGDFDSYASLALASAR